MNDETEAIIDELHPAIQRHAIVLVTAVREAGIPLVLISGRRSPARNVAVGGALTSMHLQGLAFDASVVRIDAGRIVGHYPREAIAPFWRVVGEWAEANLGLRWGGRFTPPDINHFDLKTVST